MDKYRDKVIEFKNKLSQVGVFYVYDTETTGLDVENSDIIEFAAVKVDGTSMDVLDKIDIIINNNKPIPDAITEITGYTDEFIKANGISEESAVAEIIEFWGESPAIIVGYNSVSFDTKFMSKLYNSVGKSFEFGIQCDALTMAREKMEKPHKLVDVYSKIATSPIDFHKSFGDVQATLEVFKYLLPMYETKEVVPQNDSFIVTAIRRWQKYSFDRLYISNSLNESVFYDIKGEYWNINSNIPDDVIISKCFEFAKVTNEKELVAKY